MKIQVQCDCGCSVSVDRKAVRKAVCPDCGGHMKRKREKRGSRSCPNCQASLADDEFDCPKCGFNTLMKRKPKKARKKQVHKSRAPLFLALGAVFAVVTSVAIFVIAFWPADKVDDAAANSDRNAEADDETAALVPDEPNEAADSEPAPDPPTPLELKVDALIDRLNRIDKTCWEHGGHPSAHQSLVDQVPELKQAVSDAEAVFADLKELGDDALEPLKKRLKGRTAHASSVLLAKLGNRDAIPALTEALQYGFTIYSLAELGAEDFLCERAAASPSESLMECLGMLGTERAVNELLKYIDHKSSDIREAAIIALGESGDPRAGDSLLAMLEAKPGEPRVLIEALSKLEPPPATGLAKFLNHDKLKFRSSDSQLVVQGLIRMGAHAAEPTIEFFSKSTDSSHRKSALRVLREIKDKRTVPGLIDALDDDDAITRGKVIEVLGEIGDDRAFEPLKLEFYKEATALPAMIAIAKMPNPRGKELMVKFATAPLQLNRRPNFNESITEHRLVTESAVKALIHAGSEATEHLWKVVDNSGGIIRTQALDGLVSFRAPAVPGLIERTKNGGPLDFVMRMIHIYVKDQSVEGLADAMVGIAKSRKHNTEARWRVTGQLARLDMDRAFPLCVELLQTQSKDLPATLVVKAIEVVLRRDVSQDLVPHARQLLSRNDVNVVISASQLVGRLRDAGSVDRLMQLLGHSEWKVKTAAADALGDIGDKRAIKPLFEVVKRTVQPNDAYFQWWLRDRKANSFQRAMVKIDAEAHETLLTCLRGPDLKSVTKAAKTLGEQKSARGLEGIGFTLLNAKLMLGAVEDLLPKTLPAIEMAKLKNRSFNPRDKIPPEHVEGFVQVTIASPERGFSVNTNVSREYMQSKQRQLKELVAACETARASIVE